MMDSVTLTDHEHQMVLWVGKQRHRSAMEYRRNAGQGPSSRQPNNPSFHIRGAAGEYACSLMLNLYWRPSVGLIHERDVGGLVEVRTCTDPNHRLIIKPKAKDAHPYALVEHAEGMRFVFRGWIIARDAKERFPLTTSEGHDPAHYVDNAALRSISELAHAIRDLR
jgi:hypothetical protein